MEAKPTPVRTRRSRPPRRARGAERVAEPRPAPTAYLAVRAEEPPEHLFRRLLGAYLAGADDFVIDEAPALRPATRAVVASFCRRTHFPEVVAEDGRTLRLRDTAPGPAGPPELRLAEMARNVIALHREAIASWRRVPFGDDAAWERRDDAIDREAWLLERTARRRPEGATSDPAALDLWIVARSLERIADHAVTLGEAGRRLAGIPQAAGPLATLAQFHRQAMDHLEGVLAARDEATANELLDTGEALAASGRALADRLLPAAQGGTLSPATAAAVARILESIGRTVAYAQDIAQVVLDRTLGDRPTAGFGDRGRVAMPAT